MPRGGLSVNPSVIDFGDVTYQSDLIKEFQICNNYDRSIFPNHGFDFAHYSIKYYEFNIPQDSCMKAWIAIKPTERGNIEWKIPFFVYGEQDTAYLTIKANIISFDPHKALIIDQLSKDEELSQIKDVKIKFIDAETGTPIPDVIPIITNIRAPKANLKSNSKGIYQHNISNSYKVHAMKFGYESYNELVDFPCDNNSVIIKLKPDGNITQIAYSPSKKLTEEQEKQIHLMNPIKGTKAHIKWLRQPMDETYKVNNLVFLIDVSSSMYGLNLEMVKQSLIELVNILQQTDKISLVTFSAKAKILLAPTNIKNKKEINKAIQMLKPEGLTDENAGIKMAYNDALLNYQSDGNNQIILMSDGAFNSKSKHEETISLAKEHSNKVKLSIMAFSPMAYSVPYMKEIVLEGKGHLREIYEGDNPILYLLEEIKYNAKK